MMLLVGIVSGVFAARSRERAVTGSLASRGQPAVFAGLLAVYLGGYYLGFHAWANDRPVPIR